MIDIDWEAIWTSADVWTAVFEAAQHDTEPGEAVQ